mmetsp:Transcript_15907/g.24537  ORF Transcript_15907/g.24537 Transcript_15907/m.24537 type:complete len:212 (-) Transcript_15907:263-898(-)
MSQEIVLSARREDGLRRRRGLLDCHGMNYQSCFARLGLLWREHFLGRALAAVVKNFLNSYPALFRDLGVRPLALVAVSTLPASAAHRAATSGDRVGRIRFSFGGLQQRFGATDSNTYLERIFFSELDITNTLHDLGFVTSLDGFFRVGGIHDVLVAQLKLLRFFLPLRQRFFLGAIGADLESSELRRVKFVSERLVLEGFRSQELLSCDVQ